MFDKTFFKFAISFVLVIGFSFGIIFSLGYFEQSNQVADVVNGSIETK